VKQVKNEYQHLLILNQYC